MRKLRFEHIELKKYLKVQCRERYYFICRFLAAIECSNLLEGKLINHLFQANETLFHSLLY